MRDKFRSGVTRHCDVVVAVAGACDRDRAVGRPDPSRHPARGPHRICARPRRPSSPLLPNLVFSTHNSPQFAGVLPLAEVAIASILAAGLWALQTRSWRATELHTARFKSTSRASRIGGTTR